MSADDRNSPKTSIWDGSPYLRFQRDEEKERWADDRNSPKTSIWDGSPYLRFQNKYDGEVESDQHDVILVDAEKQMYHEELPDVIFSEPPPGYFEEFNVETVTTDADAPENNVDSQFMEDESFAKDTTLGQAMDIVMMDSAIGIHDEDVQKHSKDGAKFLDNITKVPLSDFWHILTRVFAGVIFITNVVSSLYDLIHEPENLHYKIPNIIFGIVATVCISIGFYILHKVKESEEGNEKNVEGENGDEKGSTEEELSDDDRGAKSGEGKSEDEKEEKLESEKTEVTAESEESKEDGSKEDEETDKKDINGDEDVTDEDTEGEDEDTEDTEVEDEDIVESEEKDDVEETNENKDVDNEGVNEEKEGDVNKEKEENMKDEQKIEDDNMGKKNKQNRKKKKRRKKKHKKEEKEDAGPTDERNDNKKETEKAEESEDEKQENVDENEEKENEKDEENDGKEKEEDEEKKEEEFTENDKKKKYQQYVENIAHEAILYPIIVLNVFGFATDVVEAGWFGKVQLVLIIIDALDITWTQIMRIYMIRRFLSDIAVKLGADAEVGWKILRRGIVTTILNFIFFIFLIILLGMQVHSDNYCITHDANSSSNYVKWCGNVSVASQLKYRGSVNSAFLLIAVVVIPLFNLVVFVAVNYHWVVELLLQLGEQAKEAEKTNLNKDVGMMLILVKESEMITEKLENMRNVSSFKRFISVTTEPAILALMGIWVVVLVLAIVFFDGCEPSSFSAAWCKRGGMQAIFVVVAVVSNIHAVAVAVLIGVGVVVAICALLFYPCAVYLFLRRMPQSDSEDGEPQARPPQTARATTPE